VLVEEEGVASAWGLNEGGEARRRRGEDGIIDVVVESFGFDGIRALCVLAAAHAPLHPAGDAAIVTRIVTAVSARVEN